MPGPLAWGPGAGGSETTLWDAYLAARHRRHSVVVHLTSAARERLEVRGFLLNGHVVAQRGFTADWHFYPQPTAETTPVSPCTC